MAKPLKVMIAGAGIGGLTLAILLEKQGVDYEVFEQSTVVRPLGSATGLMPNVLALFEQIGLLAEIEDISRVGLRMEVFQESLDRINSVEFEPYKSMQVFLQSRFWLELQFCGYNTLVTPRPDLHKLLLSHVPAEKIHMGKKIVSIKQDDHSVTIHTSNNHSHTADILIGSDGAYSGVRHSLYKEMKDKGCLPASDDEDLKACHMSVLGTTRPLDTTLFPLVKGPYSKGDVIIGSNKPHTWRYFTAKGDRVCWRVDVQIEAASVADDMIRSEWGPESFDTMEHDWRSFKLPIGGTIGDMIEATPRESISRVVLEEKLHQTWFHNRTVLIGDACHKMLPNSGRGGVNAILDAVVLANAIYEMEDSSSANLQAAFQQYYDERFPLAEADFYASRQAARLFAGQTWKDKALRFVIFNVLPGFTQRQIYAKSLSYRPQLSYLPQVPKKGDGLLVEQKPSKRYASELAKQKDDVAAQ
ncbi:hypothetical protein BGZ74_009901 [Mortierella antarctica]|nr:hypothetical protein BGZ74_009901 [Mortierella antarctica]